MVQWLRILLPMQRTQVQSLVLEDLSKLQSNGGEDGRWGKDDVGKRTLGDAASGVMDLYVCVSLFLPCK